MAKFVQSHQSLMPGSFNVEFIIRQSDARFILCVCVCVFVRSTFHFVSSDRQLLFWQELCDECIHR